MSFFANQIKVRQSFFLRPRHFNAAAQCLKSLISKQREYDQLPATSSGALMFFSTNTSLRKHGPYKLQENNKKKEKIPATLSHIQKIDTSIKSFQHHNCHFAVHC